MNTPTKPLSISIGLAASKPALSLSKEPALSLSKGRLMAASSRLTAALVLALGFATSDGSTSLTTGLVIWSPLPIVAGLFWQLGQWRGWRWIASPAMAGFVGLAAFGMLRDVLPIWMLIGAVAALTAWDLDHFFQRTASVQRIEGEGPFVRAHFRRVWIVAGWGLLLGLIALNLQIRLDLGWAIVLGLLAVISLAQAVRYVRRESE